MKRALDKAGKMRTYPWEGPLFLLIRNTYQAYAPSAGTRATVAAALDGVVVQAWLVNHREGVVDASPPRPRLVRLA
ncbi:MAG: hypothetical protein O2894_09195 [Planctomycetota bacterium]|nr:hypothetical protein [Planctomycetota bacterium]